MWGFVILRQRRSIQKHMDSSVVTIVPTQNDKYVILSATKDPETHGFFGRFTRSE